MNVGEEKMESFGRADVVVAFASSSHFLSFGKLASVLALPSALGPSVGGSPRIFRALKKVIWLILPVVICLSQRLSHACPSTSLIKVKPRMAH
jgi:hypothetical protein